MDMDDQYWANLEVQGALLHSRLKELFDSGPVRLATDRLRIPNTPESKLARYLHILSTRHPFFALEKLERSKEIRNLAIAKFCIDTDSFPKKFFSKWIKRQNEAGIGITSLSQKQKDQLRDAVIEGQRKRLKQWIKFLADPENEYPIWFKYYVLSNIVKLKEYDTKTGRYPRRSNSSTSNFPELNPSVIDNIYKHITDPEFHANKRIALLKQYFRLETRDEILELPEIDASFQRLFEFWSNDFLRCVKDSDFEITDGKWIKFEERSSAADLSRSVSGYNTGWCISNIGEAEMMLREGDIYVYFTALPTGEYVVPRISIRTSGDIVREVRGRDQHQEIESNLLEIAKEKLAQLRGGYYYFDTVSDMKELTRIYEGMKNYEVLTRADLSFLYQIEKSIRNFGMRDDPRIAEILSKRDVKQDMAFIFGCEKEEVALSVDELTESTVVCVFDIDRKTMPGEMVFENVFAVIGNANFERMPDTFPNVTFVTGSARPGKNMKHIAIVGGTLSYINSYQPLEELIKVGGNAILSSTHGQFPKLEYIGGSLSANNSTASFPALKRIKGDASFAGSRLRDVRPDLIIDGTLTGNSPFLAKEPKYDGMVL